MSSMRLGSEDGAFAAPVGLPGREGIPFLPGSICPWVVIGPPPGTVTGVGVCAKPVVATRTTTAAVPILSIILFSFFLAVLVQNLILRSTSPVADTPLMALKLRWTVWGRAQAPNRTRNAESSRFGFVAMLLPDASSR